jgi:predicted rRNA methylase YqxC with S4 and FtsJ domains
LRWIKTGGLIVSLVKPHYELEPEEKRLLVKGVLPEDDSTRVAERTRERMGEFGAEVRGWTRSPIAGGASKGRKGNIEFLALLTPTSRA